MARSEQELDKDHKALQADLKKLPTEAELKKVLAKLKEFDPLLAKLNQIASGVDP